MVLSVSVASPPFAWREKGLLSYGGRYTKKRRPIHISLRPTTASIHLWSSLRYIAQLQQCIDNALKISWSMW